MPTRLDWKRLKPGKLLSGTLATPAGVVRLRRALPHAEIIE